MSDASPTAPVTVLVADDNTVVRAVLRDMLHPGTGVRLAGEAADGQQALDAARRLKPDVTLLDHRMPLRDGLSVVVAISEFSKVLMLTRISDDALVLEAVRAGALGFLVHGQFSPAELVQAIHAVAGGEAHLSPSAARALMTAVRERPAGPVADPHGLSPRERQIMDLMVAGEPNSGISARLGIAEKTVRNQVSQIYRKLNVRNRAQAVVFWLNRR
jgi:DNA-binding NarL/FixJ family response regulator